MIRVRIGSQRLALLLALLLPALAVPLGADYLISGTTFLPQQFYVGDRVEMRVGVRTAITVGLSVPEPLPALEWGDLHHVRLLPRGADWELRIAFTSFQPGTRTLPPLDLGAFTVSDLSVHIPSILEAQGRSETAPPQAQVVLPGTRLWISLVALLLLLLPILWMMFVRRGKRYLQEFVRRYRERQPYRRLARAMKQLAAVIEEIDGREFYIALLEHIRRYMSTRLRIDCMAATTSELGAVLDRLLPAIEERRWLLDLFRYGDLVKFAAAPSPVSQRAEHLAQLGSLIERLEQRGDARAERIRGPGRGARKRRREYVGV